MSIGPSRKSDHLRINLEANVASAVGAGFDRYRFLPRALPELDFESVSTHTTFLGQQLKAPLLVSCMTGGVSEATAINRTLAGVAEAAGIALGLGSGRALVEDPSLLPTFAVRDLAPSIPLLANIGGPQLLRGPGVDGCRRLVDLLQADALVVHLNALQEALQPEGTPHFAGLLDQIAELCHLSEVPVIVKEVGFGIAPDDVGRLLAAGVAAVDLAGAGGTSWSEVERHRLPPQQATVAAEFGGWGLPTAEAIRRARLAHPEAVLIGSGGIATGLEVAIAVALGADLAGVAGPFLRAAAGGPAEAGALAEQLIAVLRIAMFAIGARSIAELRGTPRLEPIAR